MPSDLPVPVSGEDQPDPRVMAILRSRWIKPLVPSADSYEAERVVADLAAADAADRAAGIRRVTEDEAIERAARQDFDEARVMKYGHGPTWEQADERKREASRARVRRVVQAALGDGS